MTFEMEFQIEKGLRPFQAAGKLEQRLSIGRTTKSRMPPGYTVIVWLPFGARGPGWVFVEEAGELTGTRSLSSTA